jgi:DNA-binding XRE family transcriptional regulator
MIAAEVANMKQRGEGGFGGEKGSSTPATTFGPIPSTKQTSIRRFLAEQGVTIGSLADGCETSKPYMNRIVNGRRDPSIHLASRMAAYLGISLDRVHQMLELKPRVYKVAR